MQKEIGYDITFTGYTIDTYNTFTTDTEEEFIIQNYNDDYGVLFEYDDFDWTYDHKGLVQALAEAWCELMNENIVDDVILGVALKGEAYSPREYNFSTDNCETIFTVNYDALLKYISDNREAYDRDKVASCDGFMWLGDEDDTMLHYYLHTVSHEKYSEENYMMDMYDRVSMWEYVNAEFITRNQ